MESKNFFEEYSKRFSLAIKEIISLDINGVISESGVSGINQVVNNLLITQSQNKKIYFVGNGGSAGISQHLAVDYWKNGKMRAQSFNDPSLLTCIGNDLGYENVFAAPLEMFLDSGDMVICISSSGQSENILRAAKVGREKGAYIVTLSGFNEDNPLRKLGDINFYVPSYSYGMVEIAHEFILHGILDAKMYTIDKIDIFNRNQPM